MHDLAYYDLHTLEASHWWYRGMRDIYGRLLRRFASTSARPVLDVGCGSGGNLQVLKPYGPIIGMDLSLTALRLWQEKPAGLVQASADALPFAAGSFGVVTLLGLIEHVQDDLSVLREAGRVCRRDGIVLLNTSAYKFLWSQHDEANRHVRRYLARDLALKIRMAGLKVLKISYANMFIFPAALIVRPVQRITQRLKPKSTPRVDMFPVCEPFNGWLTYLLKFEGWLIERLNLPFGVSILAVLAPDQEEAQS